MPMSALTHGKRSRRYWCCAAAALMLAATQARAQINPFRAGRHEARLSEQDLDLLQSSANQLNRAPGVAVGATVRWSNPKTGSHGTASVERIFKQRGMICHLLRHEVYPLGEPQPRRYDLTWCLTADGEWKVLN